MVDVHVGGRDDAELLRGHVDDGDALLLDRGADLADRARHRLERSGRTLGLLDEEEGDRLPVGRPARLGEVAVEVGELFVVDEELLLGLAGEPGERAVGRERHRRRVVDMLPVRAVGVRGREAVPFDDPRHPLAVGRDLDVRERARLVEIVEKLVVTFLSGGNDGEERTEKSEGSRAHGAGE